MKRSLLRREWAYRNTLLLAASIMLLIVLADMPLTRSVIQHIGSYGYIGSFFTGIFFVSTFTVAPASLVLFNLAEQYSPTAIALTAGAGAVVGDLLIFRFLKDGVFTEFAPLASRFKESHVFALFKSPYFAFLAPVIGAFIIASPFPDEIGIGMMGLTKIKKWQFALLTYGLNTVGIFIIVFLARI